MKEILECLGLDCREVVSIIGCGGKTTLLWGLARHFRSRRVLVSTTTKIGVPPEQFYDSITDARTLDALLPPAQILNGVHLAGTLHEIKGHVKSLPISDLQALLPSFDLTILECDGSRSLPVKGWARHEPVVPDFTTSTICLATVWAEGLPVDETTVHRPEIFCAISGATPGSCLTLEHMAHAISHPEGLMAQAKSRKVLMLNQLDTPAAKEKAAKLVALLPEYFLESIDRVVLASLKNGWAKILWQNPVSKRVAV